MKTPPGFLILPAAVAALVCFSTLVSLAQSEPGVTFTWDSQKASSANAAIMAYLGDPVTPPANLDPKYTPEGLTAAFRQLSQNLGFKVQRLAVDQSEFPFLVYGIIEGRQSYNALKEGLSAMPGYAYSGSSTGNADGSTYFALNMMPQREYPREVADAIHRRSMIRLQMLAAIWKAPPRN